MGIWQVVALVIGALGLLCCSGKAMAGERLATERVPFVAAVGSGLTLNDCAAIIGIVVSVATFILNWHYQKKRLELEKRRLFVNDAA